MSNNIWPLRDDLDELVKQERISLESTSSESSSEAIAIFDLTGSTEMKLTEGHRFGTQNAILHNRLCASIANRFNGVLVKELGDGILVKFEDPMDACLAGVNIMTAIKNYTNFSTKGSMTFGKIDNVTIDGRIDILGSAVDRCAKLLHQAEPYDLILDSSFNEIVRSYISDYPTLTISKRNTVRLEGFGSVDVYNLEPQTVDFEITVHGRREISEKRDFINNATDEVIELGIGITTFSDYFFSLSDAVFKKPVIKLLERGVDFKCIMLDPESEIAEIYAEDTNEPEYVDEMNESQNRLLNVKEEFEDMDLEGNFEILTYEKFPRYHAVCVDCDHPQAKMFVSHYMYELDRAETPGMAFSKFARPTLFDRYLTSIEQLIDDAESVAP